MLVIRLLLSAARSASVVETDATGCVDREELELAIDDVRTPEDAVVAVSTSVVGGLFGVDVTVTLGSASDPVWTDRIELSRADCPSVPHTVALSVEVALRPQRRAPPPPRVRPVAPAGPVERFAAVGVGAGTDARVAELGLRGGWVRPVGRAQVELALGAAAGMPVPIDPIGVAHLVHAWGSVGLGPRSLDLDPVRVRAMAVVAGGGGLSMGSGLFEAYRVFVPRLLPGASLSFELERVHLGVSVATPVPRLAFVVRGGVGSSPVREPALRLGFEIGVRGVGKVGRTDGPES